jgi:hypothetical protein
MNKIIILVGENIYDLQFQCGGRNEQGLFVEDYGQVKWIHYIESTSRRLPETNKHPRVYQNYLINEVDYVLKHWNLLITTNSANTIDIVCRLAYDGKLRPEQVLIHGLSEDNKEIIFTSTLDTDKYYLLNWPYGFMDIS